MPKMTDAEIMGMSDREVVRLKNSLSSMEYDKLKLKLIKQTKEDLVYSDDPYIHMNFHYQDCKNKARCKCSQEEGYRLFMEKENKIAYLTKCEKWLEDQLDYFKNNNHKTGVKDA